MATLPRTEPDDERRLVLDERRIRISMRVSDLPDDEAARAILALWDLAVEDLAMLVSSAIAEVLSLRVTVELSTP